MTIKPTIQHVESRHTVPLIVGGKDVLTDTFFSVAPTGQNTVIWESSSASKPDALAAVESAAEQFPAWAQSKPATRREILLKTADILESRREELKGYMKDETGSHDPFANSNINWAIDILRDVAGRIASGLTGTLPICEEEGKHAMILKEPFGVILAIAPWNAPYVLGVRSVAYALAAGNTCVLKGSEAAPRAFWAIGSAFREAGLPPGCLNVIYSQPQDAAEVTTALIEHPAVKKINFTGSTAVGSIIAATAGENLKPVLMELGGKASAIVCEDADLQKAAQQCALGSFLHAGQICMSTERILVHEKIYQPFRDALEKAVEAIFGSSEPQALALSGGASKVRKLISDAVAKGAVSKHSEVSEEHAGHRLKPAIVENVTKGMDIYHTESFGPSVSLFSVSSDEEAIKVANDTEYGLSGAVFTADLARGLSIARRIDSGAIHINSMSVHDEAGLPHGGVKKSGWGRFNAEFGMEEFLKTKTIMF